jgi:hypothetical protein
MAQDLSQRNQIIIVVGQKLVGHRVAEKVRVQLNARYRTVLVAKSPHTTISQRPPFTNEHLARCNGWPGVEISLKCLASQNRKWNRPLLATFSKSKND